MSIALEEAENARLRGEVPVGAVLIHQGKLIAKAGNRTRELSDPTAHAEILVIRETCKLLGTERLNDHDLYVTLEPCPMCAAAISFARIRRIYYGAADVKSGGVDNGPCVLNSSSCHHQPEVISGIREKESEKLLKDFFASKRGT